MYEKVDLGEKNTILGVSSQLFFKETKNSQIWRKNAKNWDFSNFSTLVPKNIKF